MATEIRSQSTPVYVVDGDAGGLNLRERWRELFNFRFLLQSLVVRDIKSRYKNSVLGILWSLLNPLGLMLVFTVLFTVLGRSGSLRQYPVFILVAMMPWNFFSGSVMRGTSSVVGNSSLVKKVYFPRELLPTASLMSNLVNFIFAFLVIIVFLYAYRLGLTIHALWVPVLLLTQLIFTLGLVLMLSAVTVFYRDILMLLDVVMLAWFFLTPIFYSFDFFGDSSTLFGITFNPGQVMRWINPMASIVDGYRTVLWGTPASQGPVAMNPIFLTRTFATAVIVFIIGYVVFLKTEHLFGEKL